MTTLWGLVLLGTSAAYSWRLAGWARGFARTVRQSDALAPLADDALPTITVIVPARNEEASIGPCVDSILATDYPAAKLDVIVVDDDSADRTAAVVRARMAGALAVAGGGAENDEIEGDGRLRLVQIPENRRRQRAHKKRAIEKAIGHARGEVILTTDADCLVPAGWPRAMAAQFEGPEVAFVSGPVRYSVEPGAGLFARFQALDFFGLMICGAGGIGSGRPNLANGANVGYRRDAFLALGGFSGIDHVTSGDDELLMQKVAYGTPLDVRFCADPSAVVVTEPVGTVRAFVHQRKRWASKPAHYPRRLQRSLVGVVGFFGAMTGSLLALPLVPALWPWVGSAFGVKALGDAALLLPATRRFRQRGLLAVYPLHAVLHAPQSALVAVLGPFGGFEWKDRRLDQ